MGIINNYSQYSHTYFNHITHWWAGQFLDDVILSIRKHMTGHIPNIIQYCIGVGSKFEVGGHVNHTLI